MIKGKIKKELLKKGEIIPLTYDEAFKIMFSMENRKEPLALLLSSVLKINYFDMLKRIKILTTYVPNSEFGEKKTERDIVVKIINDKEREPDIKVLIELNIAPQKRQVNIDRNLYYLAERFSTGLKENETYDRIEETILVNLSTFYINKRCKKIFDEYYLKNNENTILSRKLKIIHINIAGCYMNWYNKVEKGFKNNYEKNLYYLCCAIMTKKEIEFNDFISKLSIYEKVKRIIREVMIKMKKDEGIIRHFFDTKKENERIRQSVINEIKNEQYEKGIKNGSKEKEKELVLNFYKSGANSEVISKSLGLKLNTVQKIINSTLL